MQGYLGWILKRSSYDVICQSIGISMYDSRRVVPALPLFDMFSPLQNRRCYAAGVKKSTIDFPPPPEFLFPEKILQMEKKWTPCPVAYLSLKNWSRETDTDVPSCSIPFILLSGALHYWTSCFFILRAICYGDFHHNRTVFRHRFPRSVLSLSIHRESARADRNVL